MVGTGFCSSLLPSPAPKTAKCNAVSPWQSLRRLARDFSWCPGFHRRQPATLLCSPHDVPVSGLATARLCPKSWQRRVFRFRAWTPSTACAPIKEDPSRISCISGGCVVRTSDAKRRHHLQEPSTAGKPGTNCRAKSYRDSIKS